MLALCEILQRILQDRIFFQMVPLARFLSLHAQLLGVLWGEPYTLTTLMNGQSRVVLFCMPDVLCIRTLCHRTLVYSQRLPLPLTCVSGCFSKPISCLIVSFFLQIVMHVKHYTRPVFQVFAVTFNSTWHCEGAADEGHKFCLL